MRLQKKIKTIAHSLFALLILLPALFFYTIEAQAQSAQDGFDAGLDGFDANGHVEEFIIQPDGKMIVSGGFTTVLGQARNYIARLNPDGTLDADFNPNLGNGANSIALQSDGKILIGGGFFTVGGQTRHHIARLDPITGALDSSFNPGTPNNAVQIVIIQPDGKILIGGNFTAIDNQTRNRIARLNTDGTLDTAFNPNFNDIVREIFIQSDGKILVGGYFTTVGGQTRNRIARIDPTTGAPDTFNPNIGSGGVVQKIAVQQDGKILIGGYFQAAGGILRNSIVRVNASTGALDTAFNPNLNLNADVYDIGLQPDGKIVVAGRFFSVSGQTRRNIVRLDPTTGAPDAFNPEPGNSSTIKTMSIQSDGKILIGGYFTYFRPSNPIFRNRLARLERDGSVEQTLDPTAAGIDAMVTVPQPDGKVIIAGSFTSILGSARNNIARINQDGTLDTTFNPSVNGKVKSVALKPDGKIVIGGEFSSVGGQTLNNIAQLGANGAPDTAFNPNANGAVNAILIQPDNKIIIGGAFNSVKGQTRKLVARVDPATGTPDGWNPDIGSSLAAASEQKRDARHDAASGASDFLSPNLAEAVETFGGGGGGSTVYVGGTFNTVGGQPRSNLAQLNTTTGAPTTFKPNVNGPVKAVKVSKDKSDPSKEKVIIGGSFTQVNGAPRNNLAQITKTNSSSFNLAADDPGTVDAFAPNPNGTVNSIAIQSDGKVLASGDFTTIGGQTRSRLARLDNATGAADSFDANASGAVNSVAIQSDGKVLAGGNFTSIGGQARNLVARLTNDTAALSTLDVTRTNLTLTRSGSAPEFDRVTFEQSTDNGATWTTLGEATNGFASAANNDADNLLAPQVVATTYTLSGQNIPTQQNVLIRATGSYRAGFQSGSETSEDKVQNAFLAAPTTAPVSGTISYGTAPAAQPKFVGGVLLSATNSSATATSNASGAYLLDSLIVGGNYTVTPSKTGNRNGITAFDATLVLRCVAAGNNCTLTANQKIAANVDGDANVTAFDATQILRYVAANAQNANTGQVGNWKFVDSSKTYNPLSDSQTNQNYTAFLIGEVDGDWTP